jgi:hypothetical protein
MATKLKNMKLTSVDLVRAGANQEADICLFKSADAPEAPESPTDEEKNIFKRFIDWIRKNPTDAEYERQNHIEKSDEEPDLESLYKSALAESLISIQNDETLSAVEKKAMTDKSLRQYAEKIKELKHRGEEDRHEEEAREEIHDDERYDDLEEIHIDDIEEVEKFNPYHGRDGRFSSGGAAASFTFRTNSPAGQKAIANIKAKQQAAGGGGASGEGGGGRSAQYHDKIKNAKDLNTLNRILESAANDDSLSNKEYEEIFDRATKLAQSWDPAKKSANVEETYSKKA